MRGDAIAVIWINSHNNDLARQQNLGIKWRYHRNTPDAITTSFYIQDIFCVKQRAKLSRLGVETASNSFHLGMQPSGILAGGIWSVLHGHYLRDSQAAFSTEANDHSNCPRHGFIPADRAQASQHR